MGDGPHDRTGPCSGSGRLLVATLGGDRDAVEANLPNAQNFMELVRHAFIVAVRRRFAGQDIREVTRYIAEALPRRRFDAGGRFALAAEGLVRSALGEERLDEGIEPQDAADLAFAIFADLVQHDDDAMNALIVGAEMRLARYGTVGPPASHSEQRRWAGSREGGDGTKT